VAKLVVGCGYLGRRVAQRWLEAGETVYAVTRSAERAAAWQREGLRPIVADVTVPALLAGLPEAESVLLAVGHDRTAAPTLETVYVQGLRNVVAALGDRAERLIYISSTGVYGPAGGEWIDEESPCRPQRASGRACLAAEQALESSSLGARAVVLRLAGIYGPGRIPRVAALLAGEPIDAPASGWLNLIHVEDAADIILAAERLAPLPRRYVVSDGHPVRRSEYFAELARLLGAPPPRFAAVPEGSAAAARATEDKRACNARMLAELRAQLGYPTYREGLAAIVAQGS
jgi:nucleoside-diphosphate-sugar epimerase